MIVSVSGHMGSGKDTVGKIAQILTDSPHLNDTGVGVFLGGDFINHKWKIKKWADKLKDIVCMLINCTREQLEDQKFKETPIGPDWNKWTLFYTDKYSLEGYTKTFLNEGEAEAYIETQNCVYTVDIEKVELTPRLLLQLLGTDCGRDIIHPNIWVNSLMSGYGDFNYNYINYSSFEEAFEVFKIDGRNELNPGFEWDLTDSDIKDTVERFIIHNNWIITDTRFPNELEAVKSRKGITIRVNRIYSKKPINIPGEEASGTSRQDFEEARPKHASETALDNATFDYVIDNNGTMDDLIKAVRAILIKENLI